MNLKCKETNNRSADLVAGLLNAWESSVRATHSFLSEREIGRIRRYVPQALREVQHLIVAESEEKANIVVEKLNEFLK